MNPEQLVFIAVFRKLKKKVEEVITALENRHAELEDNLKITLTELVQIINDKLATIKDGKDGESIKGDKGEDGITPTKAELEALIKPLIPKPIKGERGERGSDGLDGRDGKDGQSITGKDGKDFPEETKDDIYAKLTELKDKIEILEKRPATRIIGGGVSHLKLRQFAYQIATITATAYTETEIFGRKRLLCNATSNAITVTLPNASICEAVLTVKKTDSSANTVTIATVGSQTIDGASTAVLSTKDESVDIYSNKTNWFIA